MATALTSSGALSIRCQADLFSVTATSADWTASSSFFLEIGQVEELYGFHFTGVTANGVPLLELTQPAAVSLLGSFSG